METAAVLEQNELNTAPGDCSSTGASSNNDLVVLRRKAHARATFAHPDAERDSNPQTYPDIQVVEKLIEALSFRQIGVVREEYAVSADGMKMFGVMDLTSGLQVYRFHADCPIMPTMY